MSNRARVILGSLLIGGGLLFLLDNLGLVTLGSLIWGLLFALAGAGFLSVFISDRKQWWWLIPGMTLVGVATLIILDELAPGLADVLGGALFLGAISLSFWLVFALDRANWWAVIPGGTLATLAVIAVLSDLWGGAEVGGLFFFGLGLTFALVYLLPTPEGRMHWAIFPAVGLLVTGLIITASATSLLNYLWPVGLVAAGLFLILRNMGSGQS